MALSFGTTPTASTSLATATTTASGFSFGAPAAAATTSSFTFGAPTTTTASAFSFGTPAATTTSTGSGFKGFGSGTTGGFTSFGTNTTSTGTTFGTPSFGSTGTGGSFFSGFGTNTTTTGSTFGTGTGGFFGSTQQQQQQQQQQAANQLDNLAKAVMMPHLFNDERDTIIAKWNLLQAYWGSGRAYFDSNANGFVDLTSENPLCRFKAIGYSCIPQSKDEDGLIGLVLKKPYADIKTSQKKLTDALHQILGGKQTVSVCVEGIKQWPDNKTELVIYIVERQMNGQVRRYPTSKLAEDLNNVTVKKKMEEDPLNVEYVLSKRSLNTEQMKYYLENPPAGIDPLLWQQAKKDNPDPESFVPIPIVGFKELQQRLKQQDQQTKSHQSRLDLIAQGLNDLQNKQRNTVARVEEAKRKHLKLGHRLLKVIAKQEVYRKLGMAMQDTEEQFRAQLEAVQSELNHPTQFKGRLNELLSQIRMQNHLTSSRADTNYQMEPLMEEEIRELLKQQQTGIHHIIELMKEDSSDLCLIEEGLTDILVSNSR